MTEFAILICVLSFTFVIVHAFLHAGIFRKLWGWRASVLADDQCPRVGVVLMLRGADPFLESTLQALLKQDYPHFDLHIVVDSCTDPAWEIAQRVTRGSTKINIEISELVDRKETCSLTCSGFLQAIAPFLQTHEAIVCIDSDVVPHPGWLRELVSPLADSTVDVVTGNRWYWPDESNWGSLVRYFWSVPAMAQMVIHEIVWAGTMAIRTSMIRETNLMTLWEHSLCQDVPLANICHKRGTRIAFVPSLLMVNRETIGVGDFFSWVQRQMVLAKLYHPRWGAILAHAATTTLTLTLVLSTLAASVIVGSEDAIGFSLLGLAGYAGGMLLQMMMVEGLVRRLVRRRGEPTRWMTLATWAKMLPTFFLTHVVYGCAIVGAIFRRRIRWRGIRYQMDGPLKIRRLNDEPFIPELSATRTTSL